MNETDNPCRHCGACCCAYRVSFYWAETDAVDGGGCPCCTGARARCGLPPIPACGKD